MDNDCDDLADFDAMVAMESEMDAFMADLRAMIDDLLEAHEDAGATGADLDDYEAELEALEEEALAERYRAVFGPRA